MKRIFAVRKTRPSSESLYRCLAIVGLIVVSGAFVYGQQSMGKDKQLGPPAPDRFRITMTGFTVNRQSNDNVLESDGKGDEVYVIADVAQYDNRNLYDRQRWLGRMDDLIAQSMGSQSRYHGRGNVTVRHTYTSILMGDLGTPGPPARITAGTAGDLGGLKTGDRFPIYEPWNLRSAPRNGRLPMLLWEGTLQPSDLVIVIPTIWEWDGGNAALKSKYADSVKNYLTIGTFRDSGFVWMDFEGGDVFGAGDRPIGMLNGSWVPQGIFLTADLAQFAISHSPSSVATGVVQIRYAAETEDYTLYFKIEKLR